MDASDMAIHEVTGCHNCLFRDRASCDHPSMQSVSTKDVWHSVAFDGPSPVDCPLRRWPLLVRYVEAAP